MKATARHHHCQLAVIGTGLAGFAASLFALQRGISTAQVGNTGAIAYTTGYLDLLGYQGGALLDSPWEGLSRLSDEEPGHPLARLEEVEIRRAFAGFTQALGELGVGYSAPGERNLSAWSPAGTLKPTYSVPNTMLPGIQAGTPGHKALIVGFHGLEGFSAKQLVVNLRTQRPGLSAASLVFPGMEKGGPLFPEVMARSLEVSTWRERLAERIRPLLGDAEMIGLPAILGVHAPDRVRAELERLLGLAVFEIPTMPPGVPGIRLREMFEQRLPERGLQLVPQQKVRRLELNGDNLLLHLRDSFGEVLIEARAVVLATGRFLSGGLQADRRGVRESLLNIPVSQPGQRADWYREDYFDPRGHGINRAGVAFDDRFRPLGGDGGPVDGRLFAAGSLLADQDWMRQRCGAGVAVATAWRAVQSAAEVLESNSIAVPTE
jgi:glycerol-3-phosphate dehydrogenase subunit B